MFKFKESVVIQQPVETVFTFVTDLNNNTQWQTDVLEVEQTSDGPFGPGATYRFVNKFLGKRIEAKGVVSEYEPERKCSFKFTSGSIAGESSFIFEPVSHGTKFTTTGELTLSLFRLIGWVVSRTAREQIKKDLQRLKQVLENGNGRKSV